MRDTTAHIYSLSEVQAAFDRLVRLGMDEVRALELMRQAYPELASLLSN